MIEVDLWQQSIPVKIREASVHPKLAGDKNYVRFQRIVREWTHLNNPQTQNLSFEEALSRIISLGARRKAMVRKGLIPTIDLIYQDYRQNPHAARDQLN